MIAPIAEFASSDFNFVLDTRGGDVEGMGFEGGGCEREEPCSRKQGHNDHDQRCPAGILRRMTTE